jgi:acetyl esterase/lipase
MVITSGLAASAVASTARGQRLVTVQELVALEAPPPDHKISYGESPLQFGHLRLPKGPGPHPVVVFVHGGCWLSQFQIGHVGPLEQALADAGYAVWSLEYRRVGDEGGGWPGTLLDVALGADHLRTLAPTYRLDLGRVVAAGHSAGGMFALWLAGRRRITSSSELFGANPLAVVGVLALAPAPDLEGLHAAGVCGKVIDKLMDGSPADHPERYRAASPMRLAPLNLPQVLIVGAHDASWGPVGRNYHQRAIAAGDSAVRMVEATESGHFDMIVPTTSSWPLVLDGLRTLLPPRGQ